MALDIAALDITVDESTGLTDNDVDKTAAPYLTDLMVLYLLSLDTAGGLTSPEAEGVKLETLVEHIDHVCQIAGSSRHSGIGSDLDGAFGREQTAADLDSIADLARLPNLLAARSYNTADIEGIMHGNFLRVLREAWAE